MLHNCDAVLGFGNYILLIEEIAIAGTEARLVEFHLNI